LRDNYSSSGHHPLLKSWYPAAKKLDAPDDIVQEIFHLNPVIWLV